jgi:hypothetical protein
MSLIETSIDSSDVEKQNIILSTEILPEMSKHLKIISNSHNFQQKDWIHNNEIAYEFPGYYEVLPKQFPGLFMEINGKYLFDKNLDGYFH